MKKSFLYFYITSIFLSICLLSCQESETKIYQKKLNGLFYNPCNDYDTLTEVRHFGLYPRSFLWFTATSNEVQVIYSDQTERKTIYEWTNDTLIKIDQYGQWTVLRTNPIQLLWNNPFEEKKYTDCAYIKYNFSSDSLSMSQKKEEVNEIFAQKARDIISRKNYVYNSDTLTFFADGTFSGIDGLAYYEIDIKQQNIDFDILYLKENKDTNPNNSNTLGFILRENKLDFYLLNKEISPKLGENIITYEVIEKTIQIK